MSLQLITVRFSNEALCPMLLICSRIAELTGVLTLCPLLLIPGAPYNES